MDWKAAGTIGLVVGGLAVAGISMIAFDREAVTEPVAQKPAVAPESLVVPAPPAAAPTSKFTHFEVGQRNVKSIYAAQDGIVWVGTSGGLVRYDTSTDDYQHFSVKNGLLANGVFYVGPIGDQIAVGTYGGGMSLLNDRTGEWSNFNVPDGLGDAFVYDALEMPNGDVWIATWTGVNRVKGGALNEGGAWEVYTVANTGGGLPNDWVYALAEGKNGEVWMATEGGLARYDYSDASWQHWTHADGLGAPYEEVRAENKFDRDPAQFSEHHARQKVEQGLEHVSTAYNPNYIVSLTVADNGDVWAGTWGAGLSRFDGANWTVYTEADGLPSNHVFMLDVDPEGVLWVGTSHGLVKWQGPGEGLKVYSPEDGLFSPQVFSMATQADGTRWVGSFGGLARISALD